MNKYLKIIASVGICMSILVSSAQGYMFGFKSWDNTPENIDYIEKTYGIDLPVVGFIFDPWDDWGEAAIIRGV